MSQIGDHNFPRAVALSDNGNYIAMGSHDDQVYLFEKSSPIPLWNYTAGDDINCVAISSDGSHIVAGSNDYQVYLFYQEVPSTPDAIPFGNIFIIIAIISIISIITLKKKDLHLSIKN
ncbi:MAG: WD40 repeat domain-containing protein [Promethearchaeota archaeon]